VPSVIIDCSKVRTRKQNVLVTMLQLVHVENFQLIYSLLMLKTRIYIIDE